MAVSSVGRERQSGNLQTPTQTPRGHVVRTTVMTEIVGNALSAVTLGDPTIKVYRISTPSEIRVINNARRLYVVTKGETVGIHKTW